MKRGYNTQSNISNKWDNLIWLREEAHILMFGSSAFFTAAAPVVVKPSRFTAPRTTSTEELLTPKPVENPCKTLPTLKSLVELPLLLRRLGARMTLRITRRWSMWTAVADTYTPQIRPSCRFVLQSSVWFQNGAAAMLEQKKERMDGGNANSFERSFCDSWSIQVGVVSFYSCFQ